MGKAINIVDQLIWLSVNTMDNHVGETCSAAADEIIRLRAELDAEGNDANLLMLEIERLQAELDAVPKWFRKATSRPTTVDDWGA